MQKYNKSSYNTGYNYWVRWILLILQAILLFFVICFSRRPSVKGMAMVLMGVTFASVVCFFRIFFKKITLTYGFIFAHVLINGIAALYAWAPKLALNEFLKLQIAFCVVTILLLGSEWSRTGGEWVAGLLEGVTAICSFVSLDLASTKVIGPPLLSYLGQFMPEYIGALETPVESGIRINSMFGSPNSYAAIAGLGIILSLALFFGQKKRGEKIYHLVLLLINAAAFILCFSFGNILSIIPALIVYYILRKARGKAEWIRISMVLAGGVLLVILYCILAFQVTGAIHLNGGESLNRADYPEAGTYRLKVETDGKLDIVVESQNYEEAMMQKKSELYSGPAEDAVWTVPEDSIVVHYGFQPKEELTISSAGYSKVNEADAQGGAESQQSTTKIPLKYMLLPSFVANRLQGILASDNVIQRFVYYSDAIKLWEQSPVFGLGQGAFESGKKQVQTYYYETKYVHNHFLQVLLDTGIPGLLIFLGLLGSSFGSAVFALRRTKERGGIPMELAAAGIAICIFVSIGALSEVMFNQWAFLILVFPALMLTDFGEGRGERPVPAIDQQEKKGSSSAKKKKASVEKDSSSAKKKKASVEKDSSSAKKEEASVEKDSSSAKKEEASVKKDSSSAKEEETSEKKEGSTAKKNNPRAKKKGRSKKQQ